MNKYYLIRDRNSGCYLVKGREWTKDIELATRYKSKKLAERSISNSYLMVSMDCEVVELPSRVEIFTDLEAKLAEKETRIAELEDKDWYEATIKQLEEQNERLIKERDGNYENYSICWKENTELKQQLAEKEKEIKQLKLDLGMFKSVNEFINGYGIEKAREVLLQTEKTKQQDKISFAVEQLEKVKEFNIQQVFSSKPLDDFINNQINELKEGK